MRMLMSSKPKCLPRPNRFFIQSQKERSTLLKVDHQQKEFKEKTTAASKTKINIRNNSIKSLKSVFLSKDYYPSNHGWSQICCNLGYNNMFIEELEVTQ